MFHRDGEFPGLDALGQPAGESRDRRFAIGLDKFLQGGEQRRVGEAFAFDSRENRLRKGFRYIGQRQPTFVFGA